MSTEINTAVNIELHPDTVTAQIGADGETASYVASAVEAFEGAYTYLTGIHEVRKAAFADPTLTPEAALLRVDDHANAKLAAVTKRFDSTVARFTTTINALEADLSSSVKEQASKAVSAEVRAHMKASGDRVGLLEKAVADKDLDVLSSVCGAPALLSGLSKEMHAHFTRLYNEMTKPETTKRLKALTAARTQLENKGGLVIREMERAVGTIPVVSQKEGSKGQIIRHISPSEVRAKRDASAKVYKQHA